MSGKKELTNKQKQLLLDVIDTLPVQGTLQGVSTFITQMEEIKDILASGLKDEEVAEKDAKKPTK